MTTQLQLINIIITIIKYWTPQQTAWGRHCLYVEQSIGSPRLNGAILWIWRHGSTMSRRKDVALISISCPKAGFASETLEVIWLCYRRIRLSTHSPSLPFSPPHPLPPPPPPPTKVLKPNIFFVIISFGPKANDVINYSLNPQWMVLLQIVRNFSACKGMPTILGN